MSTDKLYIAQHLKLFDACIKPILLYGSEIWGTDFLGTTESLFDKRYNNFIPDKIFLKFAKMLLGVDKSAVNIAVLAEICRYPIAISCIKASVNYWCHMTNATSDSIISKTYKEGTNNKLNYFEKLRKFFSLVGFEHVWANQCTFSKKRLTNAISKKLEEKYITFWKKAVNDNNKLNNYEFLKHNYEEEKYLHVAADKQDLCNFIKIRISNSKLFIEQGRHLKIPRCNRICKLCNSEVEDEFHFVLRCNKLNKERLVLYNQITNIVPGFPTFNEQNKFKFILSFNDLEITNICVKGISNMYQKRVQMIS